MGKLFMKALESKLSIRKPDLEKTASKLEEERLEILKKDIDSVNETVKMKKALAENQEAFELLSLVFQEGEKTASHDEYDLDLEKFSSAITQRVNEVNNSIRCGFYSPEEGKLLKVAFSSLWDKEIVDTLSPIKIATTLMTNDLSYLRGISGLKYDFIKKAESIKKANLSLDSDRETMAEQILQPHILKRIGDEIDSELSRDLEEDFQTQFDALPLPYQEQIMAMVNEGIPPEEAMAATEQAIAIENPTGQEIPTEEVPPVETTPEQSIDETPVPQEEPQEATAEMTEEKEIPEKSEEKEIPEEGAEEKTEEDSEKKAEATADLERDKLLDKLGEDCVKEVKNLGELKYKNVTFKVPGDEIKRRFPRSTYGGPWASTEFNKEKSSTKGISKENAILEKLK